MRRATPEGVNGRSDSFVAKNKVRIGAPDIVKTTSAKKVGASGNGGPSANNSTRLPRCLDAEGSDSLHRTICGVDCISAKEGPNTEEPFIVSGTMSIPSPGRSASWCSAETSAAHSS